MKMFSLPLLGMIALSFLHAPARAEVENYSARLAPLNSSVTKLETSGEATFTTEGDKLAIVVHVKNAPAGIVHLQHFHGFKTGDKDATCPTAAADANGDKIIDLIETEPMAGTTMVPFHDDPVSMEIPAETYPKASTEGAYHYEKMVSLKKLEEAFGKAFGGQNMDLDRRVVFVHGIAPDTKLPSSVASLGDIPAHVTLPIACGVIEKE